MNNCVCLICYKPNDVWVEFLSKFIKYDIYIVVDDNSKDYKKQYSNLSNINIIQIKDEECKNNGFIDMNYIMKKKITAWEKSIYYFSTINTSYNNVWFLEDDIFLYDEESLLSIDSKYDNSDLLSSSYSENINGYKNYWHWGVIDINFRPPYYSAMVCGVRISSNLLSKIRNYANEHNTLFFLEALFPSICKTNNMKYDTPEELRTVVWRENYVDNDIDKHNLYHPVKDIIKHEYYRDMLNTK